MLPRSVGVIALHSVLCRDEDKEPIVSPPQLTNLGLGVDRVSSLLGDTQDDHHDIERTLAFLLLGTLITSFSQMI